MRSTVARSLIIKRWYIIEVYLQATSLYTIDTNGFGAQHMSTCKPETLFPPSYAHIIKLRLRTALLCSPQNMLATVQSSILVHRHGDDRLRRPSLLLCIPGLHATARVSMSDMRLTPDDQIHERPPQGESSSTSPGWRKSCTVTAPPDIHNIHFLRSQEALAGERGGESSSDFYFND